MSPVEIFCAGRSAAAPGSRREALAALGPFLILGALPPLMNYLHLAALMPNWLNTAFALGLIGLLGGTVLAGLLRGLPRWFLPYLGVALALFSVYGFFELLEGLPRALVHFSDPWFWRQVAYQGSLWLGLPVMGLALLAAVGLLPPLRPFYWRVRRDWTLLSFSLYGAALFALFLTFDDYVNEEPYHIAAMLLLAAGGWFYLRGRRPWPRIVALLAGLTLAMAVAATGKAIIFASPDWPYPRFPFTWQSEALSTVIMWGWLVVAVLAPVLVTLLPGPAEGAE